MLRISGNFGDIIGGLMGGGGNRGGGGGGGSGGSDIGNISGIYIYILHLMVYI